MKNKSISVFLPTYNEEENIKAAVTAIQKYLKKQFSDYEIIVINDGSTDKTEEIVKGLIVQDKKIKLINHKKNLGYGAALRSGFSNASKDLIFYTDADSQFDIHDLDKLLPLVNSYDIISGYRIKRQDPLMRIFIAATYNVIIKTLFDLPVRDIDASFKLYKREILDNLTLKANTGLIDAEVLIKARKKGYRIGQIGVNHYPRVNGRTIYEVGNRNKIFAFVRPAVVTDILTEIRNLWRELR